jgi:YfiH family protein
MLFLPGVALAEDVVCFTTSVHGGVSKGNYKSFNLGDHVGDNQKRVAINRQLLTAILTQQIANRNDANNLIGFPELMPIKWLHQAHSTNICDYDSILDGIYDGVETLSKNTPLAVMSADCLPIVIACGKSGKIAAVHAGWRGLVDEFLAKVIACFEDPETLSVWLGPHISAAKFEISDTIVEYFTPYSYAIHPQKQEGKYLVDLTEVAIKQLASLGVVNVQVSPICTYANDDCFSHRRITHLGQLQTGRMATVVVRI